MILIDRMSVVRIHLDQLELVTHAYAPGPAEVIYASIALRFLFDGGVLGRVGQELGIPIMIHAPDLTNVPITETLFFVCGGYSFGGKSVAPYYVYREPDLRSPNRPQFERQVAASPRTHSLQEIRIGRFKELPCLAMLGNVFSRENVVRYVANKCGGAHHHDNADRFDTMEQRLTQIGQALGLEGDRLPAVFLETIGTAWFLLQSPSVRALRKALKAKSPPTPLVPLAQRASPSLY